jgi:hypothetical protein
MDRLFICASFLFPGLGHYRDAGGVPGARNRSHGFADKPGPGVVLLHQCNRQRKVFVLGSIRRLACRYIGDGRSETFEASRLSGFSWPVRPVRIF